MTDCCFRHDEIGNDDMVLMQVTKTTTVSLDHKPVTSTASGTSDRVVSRYSKRDLPDEGEEMITLNRTQHFRGIEDDKGDDTVVMLRHDVQLETQPSTSYRIATGRV